MFGLVLFSGCFPFSNAFPQVYNLDFSTALTLKEHGQKNANFLVCSKLEKPFVTREARKEVSDRPGRNYLAIYYFLSMSFTKD